MLLISDKQLENELRLNPEVNKGYRNNHSKLSSRDSQTANLFCLTDIKNFFLHIEYFLNSLNVYKYISSSRY